MSDDFFAPPPFKADEALVSLRRSVRDTRQLTERGQGFDLKGQAVLMLELEADRIKARVAKRPSRSPEWDTRWLASTLDVRKFLDELKQRISRWGERDD